MARLGCVRNIVAVLIVAAVGCRHDAGSPERNKPHPVQAGTAPVQSVPPGTAGAAAGAATTATPVPPPPGDDKLTPVPADIAAKVGLQEIAHGLSRPVLLTVAPGDARRRLFIIEQRGAIRILENGTLAQRPLFTIGNLSTGEEEGLLGLAFHPKYQANGKLYVNYTAKDKSTHVVEYTVSAKDPDAVDTKAARELLHIAQPYSNHNGGNLAFGPDGKLYTGMGDGGAANDPHGNGQNDKALLAKLLRIDVDGPKPTVEIVHKGLRNPWRFSFDAKTGDLYIGDVGQNLWEEVDGVRANDKTEHNFGWNIVEGTHCFDADTGTTKKTCDATGLTPPLVEYPHEQGCSITGGYVYRGKALPQLDGRYFYADYCTGLLRSFVWKDGNYVREHWDWKAGIDKQAVITQVSSWGQDADGELYIIELTGSIYKLVPKS